MIYGSKNDTNNNEKLKGRDKKVNSFILIPYFMWVLSFARIYNRKHCIFMVVSIQK